MQAVLERAIEAVSGRAVALVVAGRTDAGVHARGQVVSHAGEPVPFHALNGVLPPDVRVLESVTAPEAFDARRDATSRTYRYRIFTRRVASPLEAGRALHWPHPLERDALLRCAAALRGEHDFTAFTPTQTRHVHFRRRVLRAEWGEPAPHELELWIEADSFMRHMVRTLVGTMLRAAGASPYMSPATFTSLLEGRSRSEAGDTAAAHGLYLESVAYGARPGGEAGGETRAAGP